MLRMGMFQTGTRTFPAACAAYFPTTCHHWWPDITLPDITPLGQNLRIKPTESHPTWNMSGGLRPPILTFSFQNPLSCNRKRHRTLCSNSTWCYALGLSSGLATDRGVLTQGGYVRGFISANRYHCVCVCVCVFTITCVCCRRFVPVGQLHGTHMGGTSHHSSFIHHHRLATAPLNRCSAAPYKVLYA